MNQTVRFREDNLHETAQMREQHRALLANLKKYLVAMQQLQQEAELEFGAPDLFYRFYHQSFKVYRIQQYTLDILDLINKVKPEGQTLDRWFQVIIDDGTYIKFELEHNEDWLKHTRRLFEAYFHARMFLDLMIWCAENMKEVESILNSRWAAVLCLYGLR